MRLCLLLFVVAGLFAAAPSLACEGSKPDQVTASNELPILSDEAPPQLSRVSQERPVESIPVEPGSEGAGSGVSAPGASR